MLFRNKIIYYLASLKRNFSNKSSKSTKWESVVGLEVHAQISSVSKLFSGASTNFSSPVNTNVSLFDCAMPGTLPVLNKRCIEAGVLTALSLNCRVNPVSWFDRKHYFYADMPAGYQITQQRAPLAVDGNLEFQVFSPGIHKTPYKAKVRIKQLQLEQDSGKSLHDVDRSFIDLNRAGVPLIELVFDPDLKDGEEAAALVKELVQILRRIDTCSCKMEEGALRVDANVSINRKGEPLGIRTEIKNIGSIRGVANAIQYEIERQIKVKESGARIVNETRAWDAVNKMTIAMRDKEVVQDYRFMPEPNLPPIHIAMGPVEIGCVNADKLKEMIPELPDQIRERLKEVAGLTVEQSIIIVNDFDLLNIFEEAFEKRKVNGKLLANLLINELYTFLNKKNLEIQDIKCKADYFGEIIELLHDGRINRNTAKLLVERIISESTLSPTKIVEENNLFQITDENELRILCEKIIQENKKSANAYKSGKTKAFNAILGAIAAETKNRADMAKCDIILKKLLKSK